MKIIGKFLLSVLFAFMAYALFGAFVFAIFEHALAANLSGLVVGGGLLYQLVHKWVKFPSWGVPL
jgi:uncharacterized membrane protein